MQEQQSWPTPPFGARLKSLLLAFFKSRMTAQVGGSDGSSFLTLARL